MVAGQIHAVPTHNDGHGRVRAGTEEEEGCILGVDVVVDGQQHGEAGDGNADGYNGEEESVADPVAQERNHHGEAESNRPWRHRVQLCLDHAVVVRRDNGRAEKGIAVRRHDQPKVHEAAQDDLDVSQDIEHVAERDLALDGIVALVGPEPGLDILALVLAQPLGLLGAVCVNGRRKKTAETDLQGREYKEENEADQERYAALNDENVPPATVPVDVVHCRVLASRQDILLHQNTHSCQWQRPADR